MKIQKQLDSMKCGITCLQMICQHYGRKYSQHNISTLCPPTKEGTCLLGLSSAATILGFDTLCVKAEIEELSTVTLPCILHWNQNHFVVLYKIKKENKFKIADPGKGFITYSLDEFRITMHGYKRCLELKLHLLTVS